MVRPQQLVLMFSPVIDGKDAFEKAGQVTHSGATLHGLPVNNCKRGRGTLPPKKYVVQPPVTVTETLSILRILPPQLIFVEAGYKFLTYLAIFGLYPSTIAVPIELALELCKPCLIDYGRPVEPVRAITVTSSSALLRNFPSSVTAMVACSSVAPAITLPRGCD